MKQMSGKKKEKFCLTIGFACNADGSEQLPPIYIGKSKKPWCFKKEGPNQCGFYYWNNKMAWMTAELFEEWVDTDTWVTAVSERKLMFVLGGLRNLIWKWKTRINISASSSSITSLDTRSCMSLRTFWWNFLNQIWLHLFNHSMLESYSASRQIIRNIFLTVPLTLTRQESVTFIKSICLKACWWQEMLGLMLHKKPLSIAGIMQKSNWKGEISWNLFVKPFWLVVNQCHFIWITNIWHQHCEFCSHRCPCMGYSLDLRKHRYDLAYCWGLSLRTPGG